MSTHGDYGIVAGGKWYACYAHSDMYAGGWPAVLVVEAADIARRGDWEHVIAGWSDKAWVDPAVDRDNVPQATIRELAGSHPDGDSVTVRWAAALIPRHSRAESIAHYADWTGSDSDERGRSLAADVFDNQRFPPTGLPSWRAAAAMAVMAKHALGAQDDLHTGVVVDADNRELVVFAYHRSGEVGATVIATADIDDAETLARLATYLRSLDQIAPTPAPFGHEAPARTWERSTELGFAYLVDGQWRRPKTLGPLPGTPDQAPSPLAAWPAWRLTPRPLECLGMGDLEHVTGPMKECDDAPIRFGATVGSLSF